MTIKNLEGKMLIKVDLENGFEGRSIAWVTDHPGCFAYGVNGSEAILRVPQTLVSYQHWIEKHTTASWLADLGDFDVRLVEALEWDGSGQGGPNWFQSDASPLNETDVDRGLKLLEWSRADLLQLVSELSPAELEQTFEGERWPIRGILGHVANAEFWYLDRLGLADITGRELARDAFERLSQVRGKMELALPGLVGIEEVREVDGEKWSARKILRRAMWHEMDHIQHIVRLMTLL